MADAGARIRHHQQLPHTTLLGKTAHAHAARATGAAAAVGNGGAGGAYLELRPHSYLFAGDAPGSYCLGVFDNGWSGTLLGGIITRNALVQVRGMRARACARARVCFWKRVPGVVVGVQGCGNAHARLRHACATHHPGSGTSSSATRALNVLDKGC